jgi:uncharacterized protein
MPPITFRYFRDPHHFSTYTEEPQTCDICGRDRPGYEAPFYGEEDLDFVCEKCLASGRLAEQDCTTNSVDRSNLQTQIEAAEPGLAKDEIDARVEQIASEVEERTPGIVTWQDFVWPAHCGDCCIFIKEVGKKDLNALAPNGGGQAFFEQHLGESAEMDVDDLWSSVRPDSPTSNETSYHVAVYLFQCLHCQDYTILWDMD